MKTQRQDNILMLTRIVTVSHRIGERPWRSCSPGVSKFFVRILLLYSTKYKKTIWASHNTFFHNNHYTKYVDQVEVCLLAVYN